MSAHKDQPPADTCGFSKAVALTPNYTTMAAADATICFTCGRIGFSSPEGRHATPTQRQTFFYFGTNVAGFAEHFAPFGMVVIRYASCPSRSGGVASLEIVSPHCLVNAGHDASTASLVSSIPQAWISPDSAQCVRGAPT